MYFVKGWLYVPPLQEKQAGESGSQADGLARRVLDEDAQADELPPGSGIFNMLRRGAPIEEEGAILERECARYVPVPGGSDAVGWGEGELREGNGGAWIPEASPPEEEDCSQAGYALHEYATDRCPVPVHRRFRQQRVRLSPL